MHHTLFMGVFRRNKANCYCYLNFPSIKFFKIIYDIFKLWSDLFKILLQILLILLKNSSVDSVLFLSPLLSYSIKFDFKNYLLLLVYNNLVFPFSSLFFLSFSSYNNLLLIILFFIASFFFFSLKSFLILLTVLPYFSFFNLKNFFTTLIMLSYLYLSFPSSFFP